MTIIKMLWDPRFLGLTALLFVGLGLGAAVGAWRNVCSDCPSIAQIRTFEPQQASKLYSHDGHLLQELGIERRTPVSINALPDYVSRAFVAVEDKRFYEHPGIDWRGIARANCASPTGLMWLSTAWIGTWMNWETGYGPYAHTQSEPIVAASSERLAETTFSKRRDANEWS